MALPFQSIRWNWIINEKCQYWELIPSTEQALCMCLGFVRLLFCIFCKNSSSTLQMCWTALIPFAFPKTILYLHHCVSKTDFFVISHFRNKKGGKKKEILFSQYLAGECTDTLNLCLKYSMSLGAIKQINVHIQHLQTTG